MSDEAPDVRRLLLVAPGDSIGRAPLGEREKVIGLLKELLPRLTLDAEGVGTFTRNGVQLHLQLAGDPVLAIEVLLPPGGDALMPPLERVTAKTGWRLIDPDRPELTATTSAAPTMAQRQGQRWANAAALVPIVAGCIWWAMVGSDDYLIAPKQSAIDTSSPALAAGDGSDPSGDPDVSRDPRVTLFPGMPKPSSVEEFTAQARAVSAVISRQRALAPEFKDMRIVHELMMINSAELQFQASVGNGRYVDPATLVFDPSRPGFEGVRSLPPEFIAESRHGYRLEFMGRDRGKTFFEEFDPGYSSYVYVAWPESEQVGPYTFAILSETARVHYRTDGRVPGAEDASVTDRVATEAPAQIKQIAARPDETSRESWLRRFINRFLGGAVVREAEQSFHESRAIKDLRMIAVAQEAFMATMGGYAGPEVLSDPKVLSGSLREMPPFVDRSFTQEVREGYEFVFEGLSPTEIGPSMTVYRDYTYVALPAGDGPASRRSFSISSTGIIRYRTDGTAPQPTDTILGTER